MKRYLLLISMLAAFVAESAAREVYRLNDDWTFYFRSENSADDARNITLPHTWNLDALAGNSEYQRTTGNYMRRLYIPADWASKRLFLRFDGVQTVADVFVNGYHVGEHRGGFTAFTFEITGRVKFGAENRLLVVVSNTFQNDVLPTSTEQNVYGGIYRDVDLILTDRVAVSPTVWGTDGLFVEQVSVDDDAVEGRAAVYVSAPKDCQGMITLTVRDPDGYVVVEKTQKNNRPAGEPVTIPFTVDAPRLWSPAAPNLYTVTARVACDSLSDEVTVRTGFRRIAASGRGLLVNGDTVRLHGVALYHDRRASPTPSRRQTTTRIWPSYTTWGPMPSTRFRDRTTSTSTTGSTSGGSWRGSICRSCVRPIWATSSTSRRSVSAPTAASSCARSSPRTSTTPRW